MARTVIIDTVTIAHLERMEIVGNVAKIPGGLAAGRLPRDEYDRLNFALTKLGGKWDKKAGGHVFAEDPVELINQVVQFGSLLSTKTPDQRTGFFPTPEPVADDLAELAGISESSVVLEPSAGTGRLIAAALKRGAAFVVAVEWDEKRRNALRAGFAPYIDEGRLMILDEADFLAIAAEMLEKWGFTHVLMNPPFLKVGEGDHLAHVRRAFAVLKPGGVLAAIMPPGFRFRTDKAHSSFKEWVKGLAGQVKDLPADSFAESGTNVATVTLRLVKP